MFTVCPKCALTLVVTAADLRVAQGYVRCGRCSSVFNALARLTDERGVPAGPRAGEEIEAPPAAEEPPGEPAPAASAAPEEVSAPPAAATSDESDDIPDDALEFNPAKTDVSAVFVEPPPNPQWAAATGSFKAMLAANQEPGTPEATQPHPEPPSDEPSVDVEIDAAFLAAMLHAESQNTSQERQNEPPQSTARAAAPATPAPEDSPPPPAAPPEPPQRAASAPPGAADRHAAPAVPAAVTPPSGAALAKAAARHVAPHVRPAERAAAQPPSRARSAAVAEQEPAATQPGVEEDADIAPARAPLAAAGERLAALPPSVWRIGVALGALLLLVQIINHYRDDLATSPRFYQPLTRLYTALGVRLTPHWDLHGYDVRQLGAAVGPGGAVMTVRASIKNATQQPQPLPLLRVTLQDRFGNRIAARDVPPRSYLPRSIPDASFLGAGQRIDAEMGFVDPGANAVGFEIDACLPASGGGIACANDTSAR
jgi:predicted Zn finger-like uncharacterized protein